MQAYKRVRSELDADLLGNLEKQMASKSRKAHLQGSADTVASDVSHLSYISFSNVSLANDPTLTSMNSLREGESGMSLYGKSIGNISLLMKTMRPSKSDPELHNKIVINVQDEHDPSLYSASKRSNHSLLKRSRDSIASFAANTLHERSEDLCIASWITPLGSGPLIKLKDVYALENSIY